ncbi:fused response regulator/phosphatase [Thiosulfativibrio zosterae]|uniref:Response regulatory domain-containing protein n=1 Tax=Thiosulfativibrio zosterae TaxID=2675053 RepID=A0A6F8PNI3_9GAMM|nr:fused response regulator/phosphatase [Thiosulfativibrio zosterae]BBP43681.1 hypothetical protein THMIRHAT_14270 [Thiosulfativibrio zosterae]
MNTQKRHKILAVDDEPLNLFLLAELLEESYEVTTATSGEDCLEILNDMRPDLMLLDVNMPGMDGYELCGKIKALPHFKDVPILFLSAMNFIENELSGLKAGAVDYIVKPFSGPILLSRINTHIQLRSATQKLVFEQNRIGDIVQKMSEDSRFYAKNIEAFIKPMEATNGDVVFSGLTPDNRQLILLGDFTGHGLAAALCGSVVSTLFYTQVSHGISGQQMVVTLNQELAEKLPAYMFMVGTLIEFELSTKVIRVWNFGLPNVLHYHAGVLKQSCASNSLPLGVMAGKDFNVPFYECTINQNDQLFVFSDGLTEMTNPQGDMLEEEGLQAYLEQEYQSGLPLHAQIEAFINRFSQRQQFDDDITFLSFKTLS